MDRFVCVHGHFYQPPRENPWLEEVERQDSSAPFHDCNQRITEECYAPNTAARILNATGQIADIVNNYMQISFNFGPTLLSWMQRKKPEVYQQIIASDRESQKNFSGHGSALAQCYNHMVMPLANARDKETQIVWGIRDFEYRFGRAPEGMWLPEAAVDLETLELMVKHGIVFTVLAPRQARAMRVLGEEEWEDVSGELIDPKQPYLCSLPSGRSITLFFYDGPISKDVAFQDLLDDGHRFSERLAGTFSDSDREQAQLLHIATDGESYGHHHRFGEMALAFCLEDIRKRKLARVTIYAEFLEKFPPRHEVQIIENSSWSCVHGVARWSDDCGCDSGGHPEWNQKWRRPLRDGLDMIRDRVSALYQEKAAALLKDVWAARNDYIEMILDRDEAVREKFFKRHVVKELDAAEKTLLLRLLEMQRNAMLMYTSCGWFFDDISGIETVQILRYAARVIHLAQETGGEDLLPELLGYLERAPSNLWRHQNGAEVFKKFVLPAMVDMKRVVAHYAMTSLFEDYNESADIYCFRIKVLSHEVFEKEEERLAMGRIRVYSKLTCEEGEFSFVVFYFGGHDIYAGVSGSLEEKKFLKVKRHLSRSFFGVRSRSALRIMRRNFEEGPFSLRHLFRDEKEKILYQMLDSSLFEVQESLREIHDHHYPIMQVIKQLHMPLPKVLANTILVMVNTDFLNVLGQDSINFKRLRDLVKEVVEWELDIDRITIEFFVSRRIKSLMDAFAVNPRDQKLLRTMITIIKVLEPLRLHFDVGKAQNIFFLISQTWYLERKDKAVGGHRGAQKWVDMFEELAHRLNVSIEVPKEEVKTG